ncbi:DUF6177 family protein [Arthrobacter pityocampae]|uniref:DUF6177 family protein n=1 Tax=Arthrobacter pityocampae TaxID=547334 RepID=UPI00142D6582|nr:DUF6177 family protein [Arthrobacter pityocampae]
MNDPTGEHPFDYATGGLCAVLQDKPIVSLSSWIARGYTAAAASGRQFAVLTPSSATLTLPLTTLLSGPGCRWIATSPTNTLYDGFTGQALEFSSDGVVPRTGPEVESSFLLAEPRPSGYLHVRAETVHQASLSARVGSFTEAVFSALTGAEPVAWGLHEPVSESWDAEAVSSFTYTRSPRSTRLVVLGAPGAGSSSPIPTIGVLTVERTADAVVESLEVLAESDDPRPAAELQAMAEILHAARARTALIGHGVGFTGLTRPARFTGSTVPAVALFGPEALAATGAARAAELADESGGDARLLGSAPVRSLAVLYAQEEIPGRQHPLEAYASLVGSLTLAPPA